VVSGKEIHFLPLTTHDSPDDYTQADLGRKTRMSLLGQRSPKIRIVAIEWSRHSCLLQVGWPK
jgi:hypothetical protein